MAALSSLRPVPVLTSLALGLALAHLLRTLLHPPTTSRPPPPIPAPDPPSPDRASSHPFPPTALPGARSVPTPYGRLYVAEFGPAAGDKVLLLPGISTPCLALGSLARHLAAAGHRVMLLDYFGRGYSDAPGGGDGGGGGPAHDERLYATQVLLALASSPLAWTGDEAFRLVGYSLGGGLAAAFARSFPRMVRGLAMVCGAGLVRRRAHVGWRSRALYSTAPWWVPEALRAWLVRRRITPVGRREGGGGRRVVDGIREEAGRLGEERKESDASGGDSFDNAVLSGGATVAEVMAWQVREHKGFVGAFMSTIRHAPIYDQTEIWGELGRELAIRRGQGQGEEEIPGLKGGKVLIVVGTTDGVIVAEELVEDATRVLGEDAIEVVEIEGGHEIAFTRGEEVGDALMKFWKEEDGLAESSWTLS